MSESFWDFSVRTYRTDNVHEACLALQDERDVDVNMLLFCFWFGVTRGRQEAKSFQNTFNFSETWATRVVRPLRHVRTWMKLDGCHGPYMPTDSCMEFREKVKSVEFTAEKMQEDILESIVVSIPEKELAVQDQLDAAIKNIYQYFTEVNIAADEFVGEKLLIILKAGVADFSASAIQDAFTETF